MYSKTLRRDGGLVDGRLADCGQAPSQWYGMVQTLSRTLSARILYIMCTGPKCPHAHATTAKFYVDGTDRPRCKLYSHASQSLSIHRAHSICHIICSICYSIRMYIVNRRPDCKTLP